MSAVYLEYIYLGLDLLIGCSGRSNPSDERGGGGAGHPDPEIRGGHSQKKLAWAPLPPPLDRPMGCCVILVNKIPLTLLDGW